jgi:hypothetical protein
VNNTLDKRQQLEVVMVVGSFPDDDSHVCLVQHVVACAVV